MYSEHTSAVRFLLVATVFCSQALAKPQVPGFEEEAPNETYLKQPLMDPWMMFNLNAVPDHFTEQAIPQYEYVDFGSSDLAERGRGDIDPEEDEEPQGYLYPKPSKPFYLPPFNPISVPEEATTTTTEGSDKETTTESSTEQTTAESTTEIVTQFALTEKFI